MVEITVNKKELVAALTDCAKTVGNDGIGQHVFITTGEVLRIATTNLLQMTIKTLAVTSDKNEVVLVGFQVFNKAIRLLSGSTITLKLDGNKNTVQVNGEFSVNGSSKYPADDFPQFPDMDEIHYVIPDGALFTDAVKRAKLAMSFDAGRPSLEGMEVSIDGNGLMSLSSADGKSGTLDRSIVVELVMGTGNMWFIPFSSVPLLDFEGRVHVSVDARDRLLFSTDDTFIIFRTAENKFPMQAIMKLLEREIMAVATVKSKEFMEKLQLARLTTKRVIGVDGKEIESARIVITFSDGGMTIVPFDKAPHVKFEAEITCETTGSDSFIVNVTGISTIEYLAKNERMTLACTGTGQPIIVTSDGVPNYKTLIMPMSPA